MLGTKLTVNCKKCIKKFMAHVSPVLRYKYVGLEKVFAEI